MRIAFCADLHLANHRRFGGEVRSGINARANLCLVALDKAVKTCEGEKVDALFVCGDLFDGVRPEPQIIAAAARIFSEEASFPVYLLRGNHEMVSTDTGDHSLGPLEAMPDVFVVEEAQIVTIGAASKEPVEVFAVPFFPGSHAEKLPGILKSLAVQGEQRESPPASTRLLALHSGISDDKTEAWLQKAQDSIPAAALADLMHEHGITVAVAGHWHKHRAWDFYWPDGPLSQTARITQLGALCPTGWDNPGVEGYGTLGIWDSRKDADRVPLLTIPGPRFLVGADGALGAVKDGHKVFVKWPSATPDEEQYARTLLAKLKKEGSIVDGEVESDRHESEVAARSAAMVARSADTLAEALAAYVAEMPLPEGVERSAVLARAKRYLEGA